jgi:hypothetical protein
MATISTPTTLKPNVTGPRVTTDKSKNRHRVGKYPFGPTKPHR